MKYLWTTINVTDLDASITFYSKYVNLDVQNRFPAGPDTEIAFLGNGTSDETLVELLCQTGHSTTLFGNDISIGFEVKSLETILHQLADDGITPNSAITNTPTSRFFTIKDPNGLNIQFFEQKAK